MEFLSDKPKKSWVDDALEKSEIITGPLTPHDVRIRLASIVGFKGSAKSGHWGHAGRPGKHGGSAPKKKPTGAGAVVKPPVENEPKGLESSGIADQNSDWNSEKLYDELDDEVDGRISEAIEMGDYSATDELEELQYDVRENALLDLDADADVAYQMIGTWNRTSADTNVEALATQKAASEEFGLPMNDYLNSNIGKLKSKRVNETTEQRKVLNSMYENTQAELRAMGIKPDDRVTLYRGVNLPEGSKSYGVGEAIKFEDNPLSSWSLRPQIADDFALGTQHASGVTIKSGVPARNILSIPTTGFGMLNEAEVVVVGSNGFGQVTYVSD